jgi:membrane protein
MAFIEANLIWFIGVFFLSVLVFLLWWKNKGQGKTRQVHVDEDLYKSKPPLLVRYPLLSYVAISATLSAIGIALLSKHLYNSWSFFFVPVQLMALVYALLIAGIAFLFKRTDDSYVFATKLKNRGVVKVLYDIFQNGLLVGFLIIIIEMIFIYKPIFYKIEKENEKLLQVQIDELTKQAEQRASEADSNLEVIINAQEIEAEARRAIRIRGSLVDNDDVFSFLLGHVVVLVLAAVILGQEQKKTGFLGEAGELFDKRLLVTEQGVVLSILPDVDEFDLIVASSKWFSPTDITFSGKQNENGNGKVDQIVLLSTVVKKLGVDKDILDNFRTAKYGTNQAENEKVKVKSDEN